MIDAFPHTDVKTVSVTPSHPVLLPSLPQPLSQKKFMDRLIELPVDPAHLGRQISHILQTVRSSEAALPKIAEALGNACQGDGCVVTVLNAHQEAIQTAYWEARAEGTEIEGKPGCTQMPGNPPTTPFNSPALFLNHPLFKKVLATAETIAISDLQTARAEFDREGESLPWQAILTVPVRFGGTVNGVIAVGKSQPYAWSASEQQQLETIAEWVAIALSHLEQAQQNASLQQQVQRQGHYQTLLSWLTSLIDTPIGLNKVLQLAIEGTAYTLQADRGEIVLLKYTDPLFKTRSSSQMPKAKATVVCEWLALQSELGRTPKQKRRPDRSTSFWLSESILCQQAFTRAPKPLVINDASDLPHQPPGLNTDYLQPPGVNAVLLVPLVGAITQGTILGFIVFHQFSPRLWLPEELELVELVTAQLSTAIIQNQTLQRVQALVEDRTAQLQRSLDVQAKLYEQTRRQVEQLRQLNQLKDEFVSTMSHELRTPLTSMTLAIRMLRQPDLSPARRAMYLDILEQQCHQETNLINDLLTLQQLESQPAPIYRLQIDLKRLIEDVVSSFEEKWVHKKLTLALNLPQRSLALQTDPDNLRRILVELLTNAGKYSAPSTAVVLEVSGDRSGVVLTLSNVGSGISPEELPHIFDKFRRGSGVTQQAIPGTGLGLALVKCLVQHLHGTIVVSSSPSANPEDPNLWRTCFTITLPQFPDQHPSLNQ